jgi:hypothetical protein
MSTEVASRSVPRPTKKLKKGEQHHVHLVLPAEMIELLDRVADGLGREANPWASPATRTEAIKVLLIEGFKKRGLLK